MFCGKRLVYQRVLHTAIMAPGSRLRATALTWASYVSHCAQIASPARWFPSTWPLLTSCNLVMLHHFITFDLIKLSHFITFYHIWSLYFSNLPPILCSEQPCPRQSLSFDQTTPSQQSWRDWLLDLHMLFEGRNRTHLGHQHQRFVWYMIIGYHR